MSVTRLLSARVCQDYALTLELYRSIVQTHLDAFDYITKKEAARCHKAKEVYRELFHILKPHVSAEMARNARDQDVERVISEIGRSK